MSPVDDVAGAYYQEQCKEAQQYRPSYTGGQVLDSIEIVEAIGKTFDHYVKKIAGSSHVVPSSYEQVLRDQSHSVFLSDDLVEALQLSPDDITAAEFLFNRDNPEYLNYHPPCFANDSIGEFSRLISEVSATNPEWAKMLQEPKYPECEE